MNKPDTMITDEVASPSGKDKDPVEEGIDYEVSTSQNKYYRPMSESARIARKDNRRRNKLCCKR